MVSSLKHLIDSMSERPTDRVKEIFCELLNYDVKNDDKSRSDWLEDDKSIITKAKILAEKNDFHIYYIELTEESKDAIDRISKRLIKKESGDCLICFHVSSNKKWIFAALSNISQGPFSFHDIRKISVIIDGSKSPSKSLIKFFEDIRIKSDKRIPEATLVSEAFDSYAVEIREELTKNVFEALFILSKGLINEKSNNLSLDNKTLKEIKEPIFILLYRIIFILYAEDREIFPTNKTTFHHKFSIKWIKEHWILKTPEDLDEYSVQERLKRTFRLIEEGSEGLKYDRKEFFMPSYYGSIFDRKVHSKLEQWNISNSTLLDVISLLTRNQYKKNFFFLDYSELDTSHLGAIYERLLEVQFEVKDGEIIESSNTNERKLSGSYYTPKRVVDYIVKKSIEPLIENILKESSSKQDKIEKILSLKIVDPAMGSGNFLVGVVEFLAQRICEIEFGEIYEPVLTEKKRDVVRRCIYGVDKNPLAVDLAKLSLWIETLSTDKPLTFLDNRLRSGNSLVGLELDNIFSKQMSLHENLTSRQVFRDKIKKHIAFETFSDDESRTVRMKQIEYDKLVSEGSYYWIINFVLNAQMVRNMGHKTLDIGSLFAKHNASNLSDLVNFMTPEERNDWTKNGQLINKIDSEFNFFHWELEFPAIFYNVKGDKKDDPGFDVIIGNPPYVRQEEIKESKKIFKENYRIYTSTADLFTYFFEQGVNLVRKDGTIAYISSNKFMRAQYGIHLRNFLKDNTSIKEIMDFGEEHLFKAITNTAIIIMKKGSEKNNKFIFNNSMESQQNIIINQNDLDEKAWTLENKAVLNIKNKMEKKGIPLKNWDVKINRGLLTGFNDAYMINTEKKKRLYSEDKKNIDIIKPIIRGRDIEKWYYNSSDNWIINVHNGLKNKGKIIKPRINLKKDYPTIYRYLDEINKQTKGELEKRKDQGKDWTNLRNCAYLEDFSKEKILWIELTNENRFAYSNKEDYILAGAFLMTGNSLKYLLAFLNSKVCKFYFELICSTTGMGATCWKKFSMERIPIPKLDEKDQQVFIRLVDNILSIDDKSDKKDEIQDSIKELEEKINCLFYEIYNLTEEEINLINMRYISSKYIR